jgi:hypothetical protein
VNLSKEYTCQLNQVSVAPGASCVGKGTSDPSTNGWCYITGTAISGGSTCTQEIAYSSNSLVPNGATINLQCISENQAGGGDAGKD